MNPNKYIATVMSVLVVCLSLVFTSSLATSAYPYTNSQNSNTQQIQRTSQQENIVNRNQQYNGNLQQSTVNTSYQGIGSNKFGFQIWQCHNTKIFFFGIFLLFAYQRNKKT